MKYMSENEKEQVKNLTILAIENNKSFRRKLFSKVIEDDPDVFFKDEWLNSSQQEKMDFLDDVIIFDKSSKLSDFLFILNTYSSTKDKKIKLELLKRYKNE